MHESITNDRTVIGGRELISFASYNYLGMSGDPAVSAAAQAGHRAIWNQRFGQPPGVGRKGRPRAAGTSAWPASSAPSRLSALWGATAPMKQRSGTCSGPGDLIVHDSLAHNSIVQGAILSGARRRPFPHNDWQALDALLREIRAEYRRVLIAIEGVYSMDGDFPDVPRFVEVKQRHKALLMIDEAHSVGTMGPTAAGLVSILVSIPSRWISGWER